MHPENGGVAEWTMASPKCPSFVLLTLLKQIRSQKPLGTHTVQDVYVIVLDCAEYLLSFGEALMKDGITRIVNGELD